MGGEPDTVRSFEARDLAMAYAVEALRELRAPGARVAVWAHNTHLAHEQQLLRGYSFGARSAGTFLRERLGTRCRAIAIAAYAVSINWPGIGVGPMEGGYDATAVERTLDAHGVDYLIASTDSPIFEPGEEYALAHEMLVPSEQYAAIFFLHESPGMRPLF